MSREVGSGWMCKKVDGEFKCMTFDKYREFDGFVLKLMVPYKEAFGKEFKGGSDGSNN